MATWRWTLYDPIEDVTVVLPLNPSEAQIPARKKVFTNTPTTAPAGEGRTLIFQGPDEVGEHRWEGIILEQSHLELLDEWAAKNHQIRLTDDLGRQFWFVIKTFEATRVKRNSHPWAHTYVLTGIALDVPG